MCLQLKPSQNPPKKPPSNQPCSMSKAIKVVQANASNPKLLIALGIGLAAGVVILTETRRRRRGRANAAAQRKDFGAFVVRFELLPFPQPPPPAARLPLSSLTFAIKDMFVFYSLTLSFSFPDFTVEFRFSLGAKHRLHSYIVVEFSIRSSAGVTSVEKN